MPKIKYHKKEKILSLRLGEGRSVDSDIRGNVVVDYDASGRAVNIDIMSINLNDFVSARELPKLAVKTLK